MTLNALLEENAECWRADDCELYQGVRQGLSVVSQRLQQHADISERRVCESCTIWE
jgi:sorting nexin-8